MCSLYLVCLCERYLSIQTILTYTTQVHCTAKHMGPSKCLVELKVFIVLWVLLPRFYEKVNCPYLCNRTLVDGCDVVTGGPE